MRGISGIIVHHTAGPDSSTNEDIDRVHWARGFQGCGYHFIVEADGRIRLGRRLDLMGAHASRHNEGTIGVCFIGSFEDGQAVPAEQWAAGVSLVRDLCRQFDLEVADVLGHKETKATACPGVEPEAFRAALRALIESGEAS